jgi:hypothetical protein
MARNIRLPSLRPLLELESIMFIAIIDTPDKIYYIENLTGGAFRTVKSATDGTRTGDRFLKTNPTVTCRKLDAHKFRNSSSARKYLTAIKDCFYEEIHTEVREIK